jgi:predicted metal-dependent peptidase
MTTPSDALPTSGIVAGLAWTASHPAATAKLQQATYDLVKFFPYFEHDAYTLQPAFVKDLGTVGVTQRRVLVLDPEVVSKWDRVAFAFVLAHELCHCFMDVWDWLLPGIDKDTHNVAIDMEANDDLVADPRAKWPWPPIVPGDAGFPEHRTGRWYYAELMKRGGAGSPNARGKGKGSFAAPGLGGKAQEVADALDELLGRSDAQLQGDRLATASAIQSEAAKGRGSIPGGLLRQAEALRRPPVCDWRTTLPRLVRGHVQKRPGSRHPTYARQNRKQSALGFGPGRPVLSGSYDTRPEAWIGIDTSGSMSKDQLSEGVTELKHVLRALGCKVRFLVIDAAIHTDVEVDEHTDLTQYLKGGGGTSFIPVFDEAAKAKRRPDVLFFYTDGDGSAPAADPGIPTVWMLTPKGTVPASWGTVVRITPKGYAEE